MHSEAAHVPSGLTGSVTVSLRTTNCLAAEIRNLFIPLTKCTEEAYKYSICILKLSLTPVSSSNCFTFKYTDESHV